MTRRRKGNRADQAFRANHRRALKRIFEQALEIQRIIMAVGSSPGLTAKIAKLERDRLRHTEAIHTMRRGLTRNTYMTPEDQRAKLFLQDSHITADSIIPGNLDEPIIDYNAAANEVLNPQDAPLPELSRPLGPDKTAEWEAERARKMTELATKHIAERAAEAKKADDNIISLASTKLGKKVGESAK